jgi:hypothetical protein
LSRKTSLSLEWREQPAPTVSINCMCRERWEGGRNI